jgi:hypothetical protein
MVQHHLQVGILELCRNRYHAPFAVLPLLARNMKKSDACNLLMRICTLLISTSPDYKLFKGMHAFWNFFEKVAMTAADTCGTRIEPPASGEFPNPKRVKLYLSLDIKEDEVGEYVESYFHKDVANLDDLACFELQSFLPSRSA